MQPIQNRDVGNYCTTIQIKRKSRGQPKKQNVWWYWNVKQGEEHNREKADNHQFLGCLSRLETCVGEKSEMQWLTGSEEKNNQLGI